MDGWMDGWTDGGSGSGANSMHKSCLMLSVKAGGGGVTMWGMFSRHDLRDVIALRDWWNKYAKSAARRRGPDSS